jgi:ATP-dependent Clp protease ATP-binding subunit ClpA
VLESLDVTVEEVRVQVARIIGAGDEVTAGQIPFTPRAKKVLELAWREAVVFGHNYIGPEHVLLALVREGEGVAFRILLDFDADAETIREAVIRDAHFTPPPDYEERVAGRRRFPGVSFVPSRYSRLPRRVATYSEPHARATDMLLLGWLLFAVALGVGVLIGWLIWG